jgi:hypothetical protein
VQNVVIIFQAVTQETESLALAFALGAVQAGGNIRLRHLDRLPSVELAHEGYGTLRTDDLRWAEGVAIFLEVAQATKGAELTLALDELAGDGPTRQKSAYLFDADPDGQSKRNVRRRLLDLGFRAFEEDVPISPSPEQMTRLGQQFAKAAIGTT